MMSLVGSCAFQNLIVFLISFASSIFLSQAQSTPNCVIYSFNATTNRLACVEINQIDVGSANNSSDYHKDTVQNVILLMNFIAAVCIVFYCCKNCGGQGQPSFGRFFPERQSHNDSQNQTQTPEVVVDPELPKYEPPPSYNECVIDETNSDNKKL
ncbi:unnamed protein product [Orchesella dallaii]|uniref:Uncharacterized protein n=1 Tax=Orchesella dallaii TaxID=48710 RepID=A0ABP1S8Z0_9HEXA